ncbi:hypothetical protein [Lactococcus lactis]|uniref:Uncharacterized protein n=1 Tax=Lactococcus lactis TaxID=1358 RepID=A0AB35KDR5_9LACT|nr:hypothetical protein [Lactococcus lactis]MDG5049527.1 hypothetical protein [Lactococcus lactis]PAL02562.1 hypothetical protein B8W91_11395 [Lactococcus lactis]
MTKYSNDEIKDMLDEYCNRIGMLTSQHIFLLSEVFSQGATPAMFYKSIQICEHRKKNNFNYFLAILKDINNKNDRK